MVVNVAVLKRPSFLLKVIELVLASICIALVVDLLVALNMHKMQVIYATLFGYLMINIVVIPGQLMGTPLHQFIMLAVAGTGGIMFITAGALLCEQYDKNPWASGRVLGSGILGMVNGCVYLVDAVFTYRDS